MRRRPRLPRAQMRGLDGVYFDGAACVAVRGEPLVVPSFAAATCASSQRRGDSVPGRYNPVCFGCSIPAGKWLTLSAAVPGSSTICVNFSSLRLFFCGLTKAQKNYKTRPRLASNFHFQRLRRQGDIEVLPSRRIGSTRGQSALLSSLFLVLPI